MRKEAGGIQAARDGNEPDPFFFVRKEHGGRITIGHFEGMKEEIPLHVVYIEKNLSCLPNPGNGFIRMGVPQDGEVGYRIQLKR